ncbi:hypothetical protein K3495_g1610 [Podosphaera aphanis]|nr:hypothetical protein K3495_g1610 [Podosphaera aphanis]
MQFSRLTLLLLFMLRTIVQAGYRTPNDAILLSQVRTLTLRANAKTSHRRVPAIPQLTCKGPGCRFYEVDIMRCKNQGAAYDNEDIEWSCSASLPAEFKLGSTDVICEGYSHSKDEHVLKGSCGVKYRLLLTEIGEEKYGQSMWGVKNMNIKRWSLSSLLFTATFLTVLVWILYSAYRALPHINVPGGFGGDDGDPWDPPPPYTRNKSNPSGGQRAAQWRPGFWSGILGGAAAGYLAGNRATHQRPTYQEGDYGSRLSRSSSEGFTIPRTSRSTRHESTGFGSTTRR